MGKDFVKWHALKTRLDNFLNPPFFTKREIWFCHLGLNIGSEEDGAGKQFLRPIIIFKKLTRSSLLAIPLTRTERVGTAHFRIIDNHGVSFALFAQMRAIDAKRLSYRSRIIPKKTFIELDSQFRLFLFGEN